MSSFSCLWKNNISSPASSKTHCLRYRVLRSNIRCRRQPEPTDLRRKECLRSHQTQASGCRSYSFSMSSSRHCLSHIPTAYTKISITPLPMLLLVIFSSLTPFFLLFFFLLLLLSFSFHIILTRECSHETPILESGYTIPSQLHNTSPLLPEKHP